MAIGRPGVSGPALYRAAHRGPLGRLVLGPPAGLPLGARPLLEALSALISGGAVLIVVLVDGLARSGPVAVVGLAAYTLARQLILGLRAEPRMWPYGRRVTGTIAALALIAGIVLLVK